MTSFFQNKQSRSDYKLALFNHQLPKDSLRLPYHHPHVLQRFAASPNPPIQRPTLLGELPVEIATLNRSVHATTREPPTPLQPDGAVLVRVLVTIAIERREGCPLVRHQAIASRSTVLAELLQGVALGFVANQKVRVPGKAVLTVLADHLHDQLVRSRGNFSVNRVQAYPVVVPLAECALIVGPAAVKVAGFVDALLYE